MSAVKDFPSKVIGISVFDETDERRRGSPPATDSTRGTAVACEKGPRQEPCQSHHVPRSIITGKKECQRFRSENRQSPGQHQRGYVCEGSDSCDADRTDFNASAPPIEGARAGSTAWRSHRFEAFWCTGLCSPSQLGGSSDSEGRVFFTTAKPNSSSSGLPLSSLRLDSPEGE